MTPHAPVVRATATSAREFAEKGFRVKVLSLCVKVLRRPFGTLALIHPGTAVPGYRLCRPCGTGVVTVSKTLQPDDRLVKQVVAKEPKTRYRSFSAGLRSRSRTEVRGHTGASVSRLIRSTNEMTKGSDARPRSQSIERRQEPKEGYRRATVSGSERASLPTF
jgi:hypothetical protein